LKNVSNENKRAREADSVAWDEGLPLRLVLRGKSGQWLPFKFVHANNRAQALLTDVGMQGALKDAANENRRAREANAVAVYRFTRHWMTWRLFSVIRLNATNAVQKVRINHPHSRASYAFSPARSTLR
jgi:hypothetical protein